MRLSPTRPRPLRSGPGGPAAAHRPGEAGQAAPPPPGGMRGSSSHPIKTRRTLRARVSPSCACSPARAALRRRPCFAAAHCRLWAKPQGTRRLWPSKSGRCRRPPPEVSPPSCSSRSPLSVPCLNRAPSCPERRRPWPPRPPPPPSCATCVLRKNKGRFAHDPLWFLVIRRSIFVSKPIYR
jgi:hypothetical protein